MVRGVPKVAFKERGNKRKRRAIKGRWHCQSHKMMGRQTPTIKENGTMTVAKVHDYMT